MIYFISFLNFKVNKKIEGRGAVNTARLEKQISIITVLNII